mmetsp:Transcript_14664/g.34588  ORF Transcript_14664/g.34588 Transcript_14664/m.34588 type:complete len:873 (+) Transcript_14664:100-2718(+)
MAPNLPPEAGFPGLPIDDSEPVLEKAFAFYNDEIRPRREFHSDVGVAGEWRKVEFGKPGGELYPIWTSTPWDLREFGLGVAMYFQTLQLLTVTFFVCGLFNCQAINYYSSQKYSDGQPGVPGLLKGSAICTRQDIVCLDRECNDIGVKNLCLAGATQAWFDLSMTLCLLGLMAVVTLVQDNVSAALDESIQTAQDYSVIIDDPGPEDSDPQEWFDFVAQFGHATFVTVAKNNGPLLKALSKRRAVMREIICIIGNGKASQEEDDDGILDMTWDGKSFLDKMDEVSMEQAASGSADAKKRTQVLIMKTGIFGMKTMAAWRKELAKCNDEIQVALDSAAETPYVPSKVFITFETEAGQRKCLKALSAGLLTAAFDIGKEKVPPEHIWKGENVLAVKEAPEPTEVFWEDVDVTFEKRMKQQGLTLGITVVMVFSSVGVCKLLQVLAGTAGAALWISISNILVPTVLRKLCFEVEDHVSLNDQQMSLFLKLTFFRWMNTAVVIYLITDFDEFLTVKAMKQVQAVIFADAVTTPLIRTLNPATLVNQLIISNYAMTQEKMNSYFLGDPWYPAERYADMTKTLFLALFYAVLFPAGLFITCVGYAFIYTVDKYSLLRSWRTPAEMDDDVTKVARGHMFFGVYCHAVMSMVFFSEFPFDGICKDTELGEMDNHVYFYAHEQYNVTDHHIYKPCDQAVSGKILSIMAGGSLASDQMAGQQERVVRVYSLLVLILTVLLFVMFFGKGLIMTVYHLFNGKYSEDTKANPEHFTTCDIQAFIPIYRQNGLAYPLIAADVTTFEPKYLPFEMDREEDYLVQSLYNKAELPGYTDDELKALFSEVHYFPPPSGLVEEDDAAKKKKKKWGMGKKKGDYEEVAGEEP